MRAIIETVFDIFYLVTVLTVGIRWAQVTPSIWCPVPWHCAPPAWRTTLCLWAWASGSLP